MPPLDKYSWLGLAKAQIALRYILLALIFHQISPMCAPMS